MLCRSLLLKTLLCMHDPSWNTMFEHIPTWPFKHTTDRNEPSSIIILLSSSYTCLCADVFLGATNTLYICNTCVCDACT